MVSQSAASSMDMVPMLIQQGYRLICVLFDNWGIASLLHGNLAKARELAAQTDIVPN